MIVYPDEFKELQRAKGIDLKIFHRDIKAFGVGWLRRKVHDSIYFLDDWRERVSVADVRINKFKPFVTEVAFLHIHPVAGIRAEQRLPSVVVKADNLMAFSQE